MRGESWMEQRAEEIEQDLELQDSDPPGGRKRCEQCNHKKFLTEFHRRRNKTDNRMRICAECYLENLHETQRRQAEFQERRERERQEEAQRLAEERQREREEREAREQERYRGLP